MSSSMRRVSVVWFVALALALSLVGTLASPARAATINVNTFDDFDDNDTTCSLREAIEAANDNEAGDGCPTGGQPEPVVDVINVPAGTYLLDYTAEVGGLVITESVHLIGGGLAPSDTVIDGNEDSRVFELVAGDVAFTNVTITGGESDSDDDGGGIYVDVDATLSLSNSVLTDNHSTDSGSGGAIYVEDGTSATITGSIIGTVLSPNTAGDDGGGIFVGEGATLTLDLGSTVTGNTADNDGGGIYVDDGVVEEDVVVDATIATISGGSTISFNAAELGGGIYVNDDATATITSSTVSDNTASDDGDGEGGGIWVDGTATLSASHVTANSADDKGGGIYIDSEGTVDLNAASTVSDNDAFEGGGIANEGSDTLNMNGSSVSGNRAEGDGGGIWNAWDGTANIVNSTISGNTAGADDGDGNGGGIYDDWCCDPGELTITGSTVSGNTANGGSGGGIWSENEAILLNSTVSGNTADVDGGGIWISGQLRLYFSTVISNSALSLETGDGVYVVGGTGELYASIIVDNGSEDCAVGKASLSSVGSNMDSDGTCELDADAPFFDQPNTTNHRVAALLADNGGPTRTHALAFDSPAVDAVRPGVALAQADFVLAGQPVFPTCPGAVTTDQRGATVGPRPADGDSNGTEECDIGAFELQEPVVSIDNVNVIEGDSGTVDAVFTVQLSRATQETVVIAYATTNGTALTPADYEPATGTLSFTSGVTSQTITVKVLGDTVDEDNETLFVNLTNPPTLTPASVTGTGTIVDDEGPIVMPTQAPVLSDTSAAGEPMDLGGAPVLGGVLAAAFGATLIWGRRRVRARR